MKVHESSPKSKNFRLLNVQESRVKSDHILELINGMS